MTETEERQTQQYDPSEAGSQPGSIRVEVSDEGRHNQFGIAGFILLLVSLLGCWVPVMNLITCILGLIFSIIGLFRQPRGFAVAGFTVSVICIGIMALMVYVLAETVRSIAGLLNQANI